MAESLKSLGTVVFKMIFEQSPVGMALQEIIKSICVIVNWIMNDVWKGFFCPIAEQMLPPLLNAAVSFFNFIQKVLDVIKDIANFFGKDLGDSLSVQGVITSIQGFKEHVEGGGLECDKKFEDACFQDTTYDLEDASLPVATRCWAG